MKTSLMLLSVLICSIASSQVRNVSVNSSEITKTISFKGLEGLRFRFEIAVHSNNAAPAHAIRLYAKGTNNRGQYSRTELQPQWRREQDWEILSADGFFPVTAESFGLVLSIRETGEFFLDDLNLYVQMPDGRWKQVNISNHSFEDYTGKEVPGYSFNLSSAVGISRQVAKIGRNSLRVVHGVSMASQDTKGL